MIGREKNTFTSNISTAAHSVICNFYSTLRTFVDLIIKVNELFLVVVCFIQTIFKLNLARVPMSSLSLKIFWKKTDKNLKTVKTVSRGFVLRFNYYFLF